MGALCETKVYLVKRLTGLETTPFSFKIRLAFIVRDNCSCVCVVKPLAVHFLLKKWQEGHQGGPAGWVGGWTLCLSPWRGESNSTPMYTYHNCQVGINTEVKVRHSGNFPAWRFMLRSCRNINLLFGMTFCTSFCWTYPFRCWLQLGGKWWLWWWIVVLACVCKCTFEPLPLYSQYLCANV